MRRGRGAKATILHLASQSRSRHGTCASGSGPMAHRGQSWTSRVREVRAHVTPLTLMMSHRVPQFSVDSWRDAQLQGRYILRDAMRHPRNFVVAVTTVVVVVAFLSCVSHNSACAGCHPHLRSLLLSAIQQSAIVFVKLSENQVGEYDLVRRNYPRCPGTTLTRLAAHSAPRPLQRRRPRWSQWLRQRLGHYQRERHIVGH